MPGIGVPAAAVLPAETPGRTPATGAQLASYAGLAPVTRRPGSSIRGERRLPHRQQAAQDSHVRLRLRLPALRPRLQGLLPAQTRPGKRPGQAVQPRPTAASRPCTPRSATAPSTTPNQQHNHPPPLDTPHRGTPPHPAGPPAGHRRPDRQAEAGADRLPQPAEPGCHHPPRCTGSRTCSSRWPRTRPTSTRLARFPSVLPDVHKGIRVRPSQLRGQSQVRHR